jgi:hypothetical protein
MTDNYRSVVYGLGMVYDFEMDSWREPITQKELKLQRFYAECLKLSFSRVTPGGATDAA